MEVATSADLKLETRIYLRKSSNVSDNIAWRHFSFA